MPPVTGVLLDRDRLVRWRAEWARVMSGFLPGLADLEESICRILGPAAGRVLDLGGGPGLLAERLASHRPAAAVTMMDLDPVLLGLARDALPQVRVVEGDLSVPSWRSCAGGGYDLVTLVMTMHYLTPDRAAALYAEVRDVLTPGGLFVVADLMPDVVAAPWHPGAAEAAAELAWTRWWSDLRAEPALRPLFAAREDVFRGRIAADFTAPASWHLEAARAAGFRETGMLWRCGRHAAVVAAA